MPDRPTAIRIRLGFEDAESFVRGFAPYVGPGTVFLATPRPKEPGTLLRFELTSRSGERLLLGEGKVVEVVGEGTPGTPGMKLQLTRLARKDRELLERMIALRGSRSQAGGEEISFAGLEELPEAPPRPLASLGALRVATLPPRDLAAIERDLDSLLGEEGQPLPGPHGPGAATASLPVSLGEAEHVLDRLLGSVPAAPAPPVPRPPGRAPTLAPPRGLSVAPQARRGTLRPSPPPPPRPPASPAAEGAARARSIPPPPRVPTRPPATTLPGGERLEEAATRRLPTSPPPRPRTLSPAPAEQGLVIPPPPPGSPSKTPVPSGPEEEREQPRERVSSLPSPALRTAGPRQPVLDEAELEATLAELISADSEDFLRKLTPSAGGLQHGAAPAGSADGAGSGVEAQPSVGDDDARPQPREEQQSGCLPGDAGRLGTASAAAEKVVSPPAPPPVTAVPEAVDEATAAPGGDAAAGSVSETPRRQVAAAAEQPDAGEGQPYPDEADVPAASSPAPQGGFWARFKRWLGLGQAGQVRQEAAPVALPPLPALTAPDGQAASPRDLLAVDPRQTGAGLGLLPGETLQDLPILPDDAVLFAAPRKEQP